MLRLINPADFIRKYSESPKLKFKLAWLMVGGLAVPTAFLISFGLPEKYAVYLILVGMVPFYYAAYCILQSRQRVKAPARQMTDSLREMFATQSLWLAAESERTQGLEQAFTTQTWQWVLSDLAAETFWHSLILHSSLSTLTSSSRSKLASLLQAKYPSEGLLKDFIATEYMSRVQSRGLKSPDWRASREPQASRAAPPSQQLSVTGLRFPFAEMGTGLSQQALGR